ncbi:MAG: superoxide dismutase family protein [Sphingorhabdus sp.]
MRYALLPLLLVAGGCTSMDSAGDTAPMEVATATLLRADGGEAGKATLTRTAKGALLELSSTAPDVGSFGVHLHTVGLCQAPGFDSAGPHWNPTMRQHGRDNPAGAHSGDLPNIGSSADGRLYLKQEIAGAMWDGTDGMFDADGLSIIVHEKADDYRTDPSGNSGKRIYCGAFIRQ